MLCFFSRLDQAEIDALQAQLDALNAPPPAE